MLICTLAKIVNTVLHLKYKYKRRDKIVWLFTECAVRIINIEPIELLKQVSILRKAREYLERLNKRGHLSKSKNTSYYKLRRRQTNINERETRGGGRTCVFYVGRWREFLFHNSATFISRSISLFINRKVAERQSMILFLVTFSK
jgi:hypothetical protein